MIAGRLRPDDVHAANEFLRGTAAQSKWGSAPSIDEVVEWWKDLVEGMRQGYQYTEYDYADDLDRRDLIDDVSALLDPESQALLEEAVRPWDEEFRRLTIESTELLPFATDASSKRWWWSRVPREWPGR